LISNSTAEKRDSDNDNERNIERKREMKSGREREKKVGRMSHGKNGTKIALLLSPAFLLFNALLFMI
jgi:hypothetical protein